MTTAVQHRRGTTAEHSTFTGLEGEVTIDTTKDTAVIHDGSLAGGYPLAKENLANVNPATLSAITGAATASDDLFLMYDTSALSMKKMTRAELNNAITIEALDTVDINGGTIDGTTIGGTTPAAGAFTTLSASGALTLSGGTANGVPYLNGSKVLTSGSALTFDTNVFTAKGSNGGYSLAFDSTTTPLIIKANDITGASYAPLAFSLGNGSGSYLEAMRLTSTGLGIGTSSPISYARLTLEKSGGDSAIALVKTGGSQTAYLAADGTNAWIGSSFGTTGKKFFVSLTAPDSAATIDSSGNLGLGVTPSAWNSAYKTLDFNWASLASENVNQGGMRLNVNAYADSSGYNNWYRKNTAAATSYKQNDGTHSWYTAPYGTAGTAISFTQAMTLDANGNLGVGTSSPSQKLDVFSGTASSAVAQFTGSNTGRGLKISTALVNSVNDAGVILDAQQASGVLMLATGGSERARIDSSGNFLVGTTSASSYFDGKLNVAGRIHAKADSSSVGYLYYAWSNQSSGTGNLFAFGYGSSFSNVGSITTNGSSTAYNTSSDYRLKEDWQPMTGIADRVNALKPVNFAWKASGARVDGFLAHELAEVVPEAVTGEKDAVDADGNPVYQGIDQSKLVPLLTAALQEALARVESLESRLTAAGL